MRRLAVRFSLALALVALAAAYGPAWAQIETGRISGTVTDTTGGVVPGVTVTAKSVNTGFTRETVTDTEGAYVIDWRNPQSRFHLSLHVSYPDERDRAHAAARSQSPGGDIMIHGQPNGLSRFTTGHPRRDWTVGCVAVTNREMREIWSLVADGTPILIRP